MNSTKDLADLLPIPTFLDLQINGCWGIDFNSLPIRDEDWAIVTAKLWSEGTQHFLPTVITDSIDTMEAKIARLASLCKPIAEPFSGCAQAIGIHIEGPFISNEPGYVGAHPAELTQPASLDAAKRLIEAGRLASGKNGVRMVTMAPEQDPDCRVIQFLVDQGICVAAGHTNASRTQLQRAIDHGLTHFTHLGNGCPQLLPRHDNILSRVLSLRDQLHVTLIADAYHLPLWLLRSWIEWFGVERVSIVSDAISAAGLEPGVYSLGNRQVTVGADGVPRSEHGNHFVGSGCTLGKMNEILRVRLGLSEEMRQQLMLINPARAIGYGDHP